ncbi:hypothetical protein ACFLYO_01885 [Chloroflexota bacterium]
MGETHTLFIFNIKTFKTSYGDRATPVFAQIGTQTTDKPASPRVLREMSVSLVLANIYHLYLRPDDDLVRHRRSCTTPVIKQRAKRS